MLPFIPEANRPKTLSAIVSAYCLGFWGYFVHTHLALLFFSRGLSLTITDILVTLFLGPVPPWLVQTDVPFPYAS